LFSGGVDSLILTYYVSKIVD